MDQLKAQSHVLKFDLVSHYLGEYKLYFEKGLGIGSTINLSGSIINAQNHGGEFLYYETFNKYKGFGISVDIRFYTSDVAPRGFYFGPYINYRNIFYNRLRVFERSGSVENNYHYDMLGIGGIIGYQFIALKFISLDIYAGLGIYSSYTGKFVAFPNFNYRNPEFVFRYPMPVVGASFGLVF